MLTLKLTQNTETDKIETQNETKAYEVDGRKKEDEPTNEECTRRKKNGNCENEDDGDNNLFVRLHNKKDAKKKDPMTESCKSWERIRGKFGTQNKIH